MKWNKHTNALVLSPRDVYILSQCGVRSDELLRGSAGPSWLPPLWSVLSFELFRNQTSWVKGFWRSYRRTKQLADETEQHYTPQTIAKSTRGTRQLFIPSWDLANRQQFILREILEQIPVSPCAFAYRKGIRPSDCARPHEGHQVLIHVDIQDFFSTITKAMVFQALLRETAYPESLLDFLARICCYRGRLPQGACTSPALSNICFLPCDNALEAYSSERGLTYTRYSDDLFFSGSDVDVGTVIPQIRDILSQHGFTMNDGKTRVLRHYQSQRVLGLVVNEATHINRPYLRDLRQQIYYLKKYGPDSYCARQSGSYYQYLCRLLGRISYVLSVEPDKKGFLEAKEFVHEQVQKLEPLRTSRLYGEEILGSDGTASDFAMLLF